MKQKRFIIGIISVLLILFVGINLYNNNHKISSKDLYSPNKNIKNQYNTLENIRNSSEKVLNDIENGAYPNLSGENINIYMTQSDEICSNVCQYRKWEPYNDITDPKEMLDFELNLIHFFLGEDLIPKYLIDGASDNENFVFADDDVYDSDEELEEFPVNNYKKVCEMMSDGTYKSKYGDGMPRLGYSNGFNIIDTSDEYRYAYYISGAIDIRKGKLNKIFTEDAQAEYIATYMFTDDRCKDKYVLLDGNEVSIEECMDMADEYLQSIPLKGVDETDIQAVKAEVYRLRYNKDCKDKEKTYDGRYIVDVIFTRKYIDMYLDFGNMWINNDLYNILDDTRFSVTGNNEIDEINRYSDNAHLEDEGETLTSIIDLSNAIEILSNTIGNNSKYQVLNIGLVYRQQRLSYEDEENDNIYEKYKLTPSWHIDCISEINNQDRTFYVDAVTGEVTYLDGVFTPLRVS